MSKTETLRIRMEPELKAQGEAILAAIGLSTTEAVTMYFRQIVMRQGLPFDAIIPTEETQKVVKETVQTPERATRSPKVKSAMDDVWGD